MICWLQEFFKNWAVAVEAVATLLLVIAAGFQWWTMRGQAQQERDRWEREDEIRAEENKPKAVFDFPDSVRSTNGGALELTCTNLGSVNFLVVGMQIMPLREPSDILFTSKEYFVVRVGKTKRVNLYEFEGLRNSLGHFDNVGIQLILQGSAEEIKTSPQACRINGTNVAKYIAKGWKNSNGSWCSEPISCPKCSAVVARFKLDDMTDVDACRKEIADVKKEFGETCPNHISSNSRVKL